MKKTKEELEKKSEITEITEEEGKEVAGGASVPQKCMNRRRTYTYYKNRTIAQC